jgi:hypothetical protein
MALVLDAGAFIAFERGDPFVAARIKVALDRNDVLRTVTPVVSQVWRDARGRQVRLGRLIDGVDTVSPTLELAKAAGVLCGRTGTADVVDALLACVVRNGDITMTSDPADMARLIADRHVRATVATV